MKPNKNNVHYRNSLDIVRDILLVASIESRKTNIMYKANLSYVQVQKYLRDLLKNDLLKHDGNSFYLISKKGRQFLELYDEYVKKRKQLKDQVYQSDRDKMMLEQMCSIHNPNCNTKAKWKVS